MPRRWSVNTRTWAYRFLALRDGEHCGLCKREPPPSLDIDHIDGNPGNNEEGNLRLLCRGCNNKLRTLPSQDRRAVHNTMSAINVCERGKGNTQLVKDAVDYTQGSPEMKVSALCEIRFRTWLMKEIGSRRDSPISVKEAIAAGAETVGCSCSTTERYLRKLASVVGPLQQSRDALGVQVLTLRLVNGVDCLGNQELPCQPAGDAPGSEAREGASPASINPDENGDIEEMNSSELAIEMVRLNIPALPGGTTNEPQLARKLIIAARLKKEAQ